MTIDRSVPGWLVRNALVLVGLALLPAGYLYVAPSIDSWLGTYALVVVGYWILLLVLPVVAIGLAIPGRAASPGVPELPVGVARRRLLATGGLVVGLGNPLWNPANWWLPGFVVAGSLPHLVVGLPLVLYGAWPVASSRSSRLRRVGAATTGWVGRRLRALHGGVPAGLRETVPWLLGLAGVGLFGYGVYGFARLAGMTFGAGTGAAAVGIAVAILGVMVFWGLGCLGLALAAGPLSGSDSPRAILSRRLVVAGSLLALVGPLLPFLPLVPLRVGPTAFAFQFVGVEVALVGLGWRAYDLVASGRSAAGSVTG